MLCYIDFFTQLGMFDVVFNRRRQSQLQRFFTPFSKVWRTVLSKSQFFKNFIKFILELFSLVPSQNTGRTWYQHAVSRWRPPHSAGTIHGDVAKRVLKNMLLFVCKFFLFVFLFSFFYKWHWFWYIDFKMKPENYSYRSLWSWNSFAEIKPSRKLTF